MLINEQSRFTQLTTAGVNRVFDVLESLNISMSDVFREIDTKVTGMSLADKRDGEMWYTLANVHAEALAVQYDTTTPVAAAVISALSPRMSWEHNLTVAEKVLQGQREGLGLSTNIRMADKLIQGADIADTLTGTKRRNFYNNIVSPNLGTSVTIDTWMVRAIMAVKPSLNLSAATNLLTRGKTALAGTGVGYYVLAETVRAVSLKHKLLPCQVQAMYWLAVRNS